MRTPFLYPSSKRTALSDYFKGESCSGQPSQEMEKSASMERPRRVLRSDAERNRASILQAFTELLASDGADVPLYRVAQRAGVGQATLYRHFPERTLLAVAVFDQ